MSIGARKFLPGIGLYQGRQPAPTGITRKALNRRRPLLLNGDSHPIINVSWTSASTFSIEERPALPTDGTGHRENDRQSPMARPIRGKRVVRMGTSTNWAARTASAPRRQSAPSWEAEVPTTSWMAGNTCEWLFDWYDHKSYWKMPGRKPRKVLKKALQSLSGRIARNNTSYVLRNATQG